MPRYKCDTFRPVNDTNMYDAVMTFAKRLARRKYGKSGVVYILRLDSWNSTSGTYEAFIARRVREFGQVTYRGANHHLQVMEA